jgi:hypothetical protein
MTPEQIQEYQKFCKRFQETEYIYSFNVQGYCNALDDTEIDDDVWTNTEELREEFDEWRDKTFASDTIIDCDFYRKSIHIYKLVDSFIPTEFHSTETS